MELKVIKDLAHCCAIFLCYLGCEKYGHHFVKKVNPNDSEKDHLVGYLTIIHPDQGYQIRSHVIIIIQVIIILSHPLIYDAGGGEIHPNQGHHHHHH